MELDRILLYSADELCRYVAARLKYRSACYSSSKLQWSGGILRCLNGMDCYLLFPVVSVRLSIVSEHRWLTLADTIPYLRMLEKRIYLCDPSREHFCFESNKYIDGAPTGVGSKFEA